jgi:hypothetical protein
MRGEDHWQATARLPGLSWHELRDAELKYCSNVLARKTRKTRKTIWTLKSIGKYVLLHNDVFQQVVVKHILEFDR